MKVSLLNIPKAKLLFYLSIAFCIFIYWPQGFYFLNDDFKHLLLSKNGEVIQTNGFRITHSLLLSIEFKLFELNPLPYYVTGLLIHLINCFLLIHFYKFLLVKFTIITNYKIVELSYITAAIFSLYAFHRESVFWILGRGSSLAVLFLLLSFIFYFKAASIKNISLSAIFFLLALFTYESTIIMLAFVWFYYFFTGKKHIKQPIIFTLILLLFMFSRLIYLGEFASNYDAENLYHFNFLALGKNFVSLLGRTFAPPFENSNNFLIVFTLSLSIIICYIIYNRNKIIGNKLIIFTVLCLLASYLPVISLGINTHTRESERFLYLPSIFACLLIAYAIYSLKNKLIKQGIVILVFIYNILFLYINRVNYINAGFISKSIIDDVKNIPPDIFIQPVDRIELFNIPSTVNGIKVFDLGLPEGIKLVSTIDTSRIKIINRTMLVSNSFIPVFNNSSWQLLRQMNEYSIMEIKGYADKKYFTENAKN